MALDSDQDSEEPVSRDTIAKIVLYGGGGIVLALVVISAGTIAVYTWNGKDSAGVSDAMTDLLLTVLPVIGTWVGTVIAFYFSKTSFDAAAKASKDMARLSGTERLGALSAVATMLPFDRIRGKFDKTEAETTTIDTLIATLRPPVSRLVVIDNGAVTHVIHDSMIYRFAATVARNQPTQEKTLKDLLEHEDYSEILASVAFVGPQATLAEAKTEMQDSGVPYCRDVFVTSDGTPSGRPYGWITDGDVARKAQT